MKAVESGQETISDSQIELMAKYANTRAVLRLTTNSWLSLAPEARAANCLVVRDFIDVLLCSGYKLARPAPQNHVTLSDYQIALAAKGANQRAVTRGMKPWSALTPDERAESYLVVRDLIAVLGFSGYKFARYGNGGFQTFVK